MTPTNQQIELPLCLSFPRDTVPINARCTLRRQGTLRLVSVAGLPMHHWAEGDRIAEAYAMVSLLQCGYAEQTEVARAFGYSTRTVRRLQRRHEITPPQLCSVCGKQPCECPEEPCQVCGQRPCVCKKKKRAKVKLADGKERNIQHMMATTFWHPDGTPMSAQQFMEMLFGKLPEFFKDEAELRAIWSVPDTRKKLLQGLADKGFGIDQLAEMQKIIDAEKSDLFDVLAHVAYALPPVTREVRAANAKVYINTRFSAKQRVFLDFVLSHYVSVGVEELDQEKLTPLLRLKYHNSIADAVADLGRPEDIGTLFASFQKYLYQQTAAA